MVKCKQKERKDKESKDWRDAIKEFYCPEYVTKFEFNYNELTYYGGGEYLLPAGTKTRRIVKLLAEGEGYFWVGKKSTEYYISFKGIHGISYLEAKRILEG